MLSGHPKPTRFPTWVFPRANRLTKAINVKLAPIEALLIVTNFSQFNPPNQANRTSNCHDYINK